MLELKNIVKDYYVDKKAYRALKGVDLFFPKSQFCSILGPSGCGKTTTLNIIGGLDQYTDGDLLIENISTKQYKDKDWDNYRNKRIGFVFQTYNLIPHLTILENVTMSQTLNGAKRKVKIEKAKIALDKVGLKDLYHKKPNQLSGGQMQRVAIARAIINDPEIVLADEPTGALDSVTSIQIMDILKEISKDRLVIMVTHNKELAIKYSDRIIQFIDGEVSSDSRSKEKLEKIKSEENAIYDEKNHKKLNELEIIDEKNKAKSKEKKEKKSSMNFFTALNISFKNILTKKGRTIATSIAGSFGIIGVALVLAVNNGFGMYINDIEVQTASQMPVTISTYSVSVKEVQESNLNPKYPDEEFVYPYKNSYASAKITYNNISAKYLNYIEKLKRETTLVNDYLVNYGDSYSLNLMTTDAVKNEPYIVKTTSGSLSSAVTSLTGLPSTFFHPLFGEEKYITQTYDVIQGTFPNPANKNEVALLVDSRNQINLSVLKKLGFYEDSASITEDYANAHPVAFSEILSKKYKVFANDEVYTEHSFEVPNSNSPAYYYTENDLNGLFNDSSKGVELKITGIIRPKKGSTVSSMTTGICYQKGLSDYIVEKNKTGSMTENIKKNAVWKEGKTQSDFIVDITKKMQDISATQDYAMDTSSSSFISKVSSGMTALNDVFNDYLDFYHINSGSKLNSENKNYTCTNYLSWASKIGADLVDETLKSNGLTYIPTYIQKIITNITLSMVDINKLYDTYPQILSLMAYVNSYSNIENLIIFPSSLGAKTELMAKLDEFNVIVPEGVDDHAANKNEQVFYTDWVGTLTDSLSQLINILTVVLIVFASISLVVSCVMTGIITYVSVIERTKEIGVLRALGARKKDVGRLFEAECVITGFISGVFGCFAARIICIPINIILDHVYPEYNVGNIASLNWQSVVGLVAISVVLTFLSSLFPARAAAKKDPVIALRTE